MSVKLNAEDFNILFNSKLETKGVKCETYFKQDFSKLISKNDNSYILETLKH